MAMEKRAVSEVAGTMVLIGVVVVGMIIVNLVIFSSPTQTRIPSLQASLTNRSTLITIVHQGGDSLQFGEYQILVDGVDQTASFSNSGSFPWSIGETLSYDSPSMPHRAVMVYNGSGRAGVVILETKFPWGVYVPPIVSGSGGSGGSGGGGTTTPDYPWYDCTWGYRKNITIDHTKVSGTQADFPVLISLASDSDLSSKAQPDGDDIVFTSADGTAKLSHEIESYSAGTLVAWVKVPSVSSATDTTIIMYYGNSGALSQQDKNGVWDANYKGVWHLGENPAGTAPQMKDSTSNTNHGSSAGSMTAGDQVAGKVDGSLDYDGINDQVTVPYKANLDITGSITIEAWVKTSGNGNVLSRISPSTYDGYIMAVGGAPLNNKIDYWTDNNGWVNGNTNVNDNSLHHIVVVQSGTTASFYRDGVPDGSVTTNTRTGNYAGELWIGYTDNTGCTGTYSGILDEVRLSSTARSAQWIATEFANQDSPSTFSTLGTEVGPPSSCTGTPTPTPTPTPTIPWYDCSWGYRKNITIDYTKVSGTQTDFPVLVNLTSDTDLKARAQADADDILFTRSDGTTKIPHEIEYYNPAYGGLVAWVKVPSVNSATDTTILMYYGNPVASSQQDKTNVWDSNYVAVYHLQNDFLDSSGNSDATNYGSTDVQGKIARARSFNGAGNYIDTNWGDGAGEDLGTFTFSGWVYADNLPDHLGDEGIIHKDSDGMMAWGHAFSLNEGAVTVEAPAGFWRNASFSIGPANVGTWVYMVGTYSSGSLKAYKNGVLTFQDTSPTGNAVANDHTIKIGRHAFETDVNKFFPGDIDEVRVSTGVRSASWITTEYVNQNSPSTFSSVGSQVSSPCGAPPAWNTCNWSYRKKITIDKTRVSGTQANFPVLINLSSDSGLRDRAQVDGDDILFTASDGTTKIPHEIESFTKGTGALIAWVNVPSITSASDTDIYLYYGNSSASSQQDVTGVWDSNYVAVYHMNQDPSGTVVDSTGHADLSSEGTMGSSNLVNSKIGKGINFTHYASPHYDHLTSTNTVTVQSFTLESWAYADNWYNFMNMVEVSAHSSPEINRQDWMDGGAVLHLESDYGGVVNDRTLSNAFSGTTYHIVTRYDSTTQVADGNLSGSPLPYSSAGNAWPSATGSVDLGAWWEPATSAFRSVFRGYIDEVRISNVARSNGWITTEYANQNSPSTFYSVGSEEASPCGSPSTCDWPYRKKITIDKTRVPATQSDFPVLINLSSDSGLRDHAQIDGDDIYFTSSDGSTKLSHEIESFTKSTGALIAWVKVPSVSSGSNTDLYMYYGNPSAVNQEDVANVWTSYVGVWHLKEASGAGYYLKNSRQNNYHGDAGSTLYLAGSKIDGGRDFNSAFIDIQSGGDLLDSDTAYTVGFWAYPDYASDATWVSAGEDIFLSLQSLDMCRWRREGWEAAGTGTFQCDVTWSDAHIDYLADSEHLNRAQWNHIVLTYDGATIRWYINGAPGNSHGASSKTLRTNSYLWFGDDSYLMNSNFDEFRYARAAKTAGWITTEYNNQNSPSTFYSVGSEDASGSWCGTPTPTPTPTPGSCVVAVDATSSGQNTTPTSGITISHTTSGLDRLMLVGVSISPNNHEGVSSITYDSIALTKVGSVDNSRSGYNDARTEIWRLVAPATGTHNVVITFNQTLSLGANAGVMTFTGVDQATPLGAFGSNEGDDYNQINVTVSSAADELVFGVLSNEYNSVTSDAGQTERWNIRQTIVPGDPFNGVGGTKAGAASVMLKWSLSSSSNHWSAAGVSVKPCGTPTPTPTTTPTPAPTPTPTPTPPWYNCAWGYRKAITIDHTKVPVTQTNFPVLVSLSSDSDLSARAQADGDDILFTASDGTTKLSHEIESYSSGALIAWVNVSSVSSATDTTIMMYYGNSGASSQQDAEKVWDSSFSGVWHMDSALGDSTSNNNDGTDYGTTDTAGKIARGRDFDGTSDYITTANTALATAADFTITAWFKADATAFARHILWAGNVTGDGWGEQYQALENEMHISMGNYVDPSSVSNRLTLFLGDTDSTRRANVIDANRTFSDTSGWHHVAFRATGIGTATARAYLYQNGTQISWDNGNAARTGRVNYSSLRFGRPGESTRYFDGQLDEIHVSTSARSADWIATEYNNQVSPSTFYSVGSEQTFFCSYVQSKGQSYGSVNQALITLPGVSHSGDLLVLSFVYGNAALTVSSVSDNKGNTYTQAVGPTAVGAWGEAYTYYAKNIAGGSGAITTTVTLSGAADSVFDVYLLEYARMDTAAPLDQVSSGTGSGTAMDSGWRTTTSATELIYGFGADDNTCTADSPNNNRETTNGQCAADWIASSAGSYRVTATQNPTGEWLLQMVTFKGA